MGVKLGRSHEGGTGLRVFENRVLRRVFGPERDEETEDWRKIRNEELYDTYSSPCIARIIKSRRIRLAGHVARMGEKRDYTGFWWGNLRESNHLGETGVDGWIILRWIFRKKNVSLWTGSGCVRTGTDGGHL